MVTGGAPDRVLCFIHTLRRRNAPLLLSPVSGLLTNDITPDFAWNSVANGDRRQIQISTLSAFTALTQDTLHPSGLLTHTASVLPDRQYITGGCAP